MFLDTYRQSKRSYAQCGEDLIMDFLLENRFHITRPSYLDIGAHDPVYLSNTYFFYKKGSRGVLVEPDPFLLKKLKTKRPRDTCLDVGVGTAVEVACDFYIMDCRTLNTFSKNDAERYQAKDGHNIEKIISVPMLSVNKIIEENFNSAPNIISLDVEGLDVEILKTFDFNRFRPDIFCVETLTYTRDFTGKKISETTAIMSDNEYFVYADTFINTIYVNREAWERR